MRYEKIHNECLLQKNKLLFENSFVANCDEKSSAEDLAFMQQSFSSLGYLLDESSIVFLHKQNKQTLKTCYNKWYQLLAMAKGADVNHKVFFPQFPHVQDMSPEEMYLRAILHYLTVSEGDYGFHNQDISEPTREHVENNEKIILSVIDESSAQKILIEVGQSFLDSPIAIPEQQRRLVTSIWTNFSSHFAPTEIPFKENLSLYVRTLYQANGKQIVPSMLTFAKTVTDVLRIYASLIDFGAALEDYTPFIRISRSTRRVLLQKIDELAQVSNAQEDVLRYEFLWKRAFERLHPGEYCNRYPNAYKLAYGLRSGTLAQTFYGKLANIKDETQYIDFLSARPTEFARKLDFMLRSFENKQYVLEKFSQIACKISVNVLRGLWQYYLNRNDLSPQNQRRFMFFSQGTQICVEVPDKRPKVDQKICNQVIEIVKENLAERFSSLKDNRKLYIDESLKQYAVPISDRQANNQLKTLTFGSRIKLNYNKNADFIRIFTHWKNISSDKIRKPLNAEGEQNLLVDTERNRVDIDLSLEIIDDLNLSQGTSISWHNLDGGKSIDCYHSGDFTTAPDGASEFIDFDYKKARKLGKYAVACNYVYTGQKMCDIPECFSGIMFLPQNGKQGEVFNPQFVTYKYNLAQRSCRNVAFAIDLDTLELIWIDSAPASVSPDFSRNIIASFDYKVFVALIKAKQKQVSVYDWLTLHGTHFDIVQDESLADIVASDKPDADISPFDVASFSAKFMS